MTVPANGNFFFYFKLKYILLICYANLKSLASINFFIVDFCTVNYGVLKNIVSRCKKKTKAKFNISIPTKI